MAGESDDIIVVDEREMECSKCGMTVTVTARLESFGTVFYTAAEHPGDVSSPTLYETEIGCLCEECREAYRQRQRELRNAPEVTVPEPPDEWRFCQKCGEQIDPTSVDGQFCDSCE